MNMTCVLFAITFLLNKLSITRVNISKRKFVDYIEKKDFAKFLKSANKVSAVIHMGAISATTETNFNNLLNYNIRFSQMLWNFCANKNVPFIYASSAATYGDGECGYADNESTLSQLSPLNPYGYSKHFFDRWVQNEIKTKKLIPPQWCGLKFFNVYGPNEYHKNRMASVVLHAFKQFKQDGQIKLFKSHHPDYLLTVALQHVRCQMLARAPVHQAQWHS